MKYIFRAHVVFEYTNGVVTQPMVDGLPMTAFDYCRFVAEDYKLLSEFFDKVYRHQQGEEVELQNIVVK